MIGLGVAVCAAIFLLVSSSYLDARAELVPLRCVRQHFPERASAPSVSVPQSRNRRRPI